MTQPYKRILRLSLHILSAVVVVSVLSCSNVSGSNQYVERNPLGKRFFKKLSSVELYSGHGGIDPNSFSSLLVTVTDVQGIQEFSSLLKKLPSGLHLLPASGAFCSIVMKNSAGERLAYVEIFWNGRGIFVNQGEKWFATDSKELARWCFSRIARSESTYIDDIVAGRVTAPSVSWLRERWPEFKAVRVKNSSEVK